MQVADVPVVRDQLSSAVFATSPRMSRFLRYVVEQTLEGNGDRIKEYAIAVEGFDKGQDYDPQADSTVRTEATKLRARLSRFRRAATFPSCSKPASPAPTLLVLGTTVAQT